MRTGTAGSQPAWDLYDAIAFVSGGAYRPSPKPSWEKAQAFLTEQGYNGMEYVVWLVHYSDCPKHDPETGEFFPLAVLKKANYIAADRVLGCFQDWKQKRPQQIKGTAARQFRSYREYVDVGYPLRRILLENLAELSAPVMCELCLRERACAGDVWDTAMDKYAQKAYMFALGCPEYLWFCPVLAADLKKGDDSELRRKIAEAGGATAPPA